VFVIACIYVWEKGAKFLDQILTPSGSLGLLQGSPPPSAHLRLILREHKIFPATKESHRVYVGTGYRTCDSNKVMLFIM